MNKMSKKKKIFLVVDVVMILLLIFLDQFTKHLAVVNLQDKPAYKIIDGVLELNFLKNSGAAFGLLVLIASGAAGNMIDRIRQDYVIDFIYFVIINFPIFNVADIYVTVATFVFVLLFLFYYQENDFNFLSFRQQKKFREFK